MLFFRVIQRIYYYVTINNDNVNDFNALTPYSEPTISKFNEILNTFAEVRTKKKNFSNLNLLNNFTSRA
jgi:hypothetical protein